MLYKWCVPSNKKKKKKKKKEKNKQRVWGQTRECTANIKIPDSAAGISCRADNVQYSFERNAIAGLTLLYQTAVA